MNPAQEHSHRAYLHACASQLVPPSSPLLSALLPSALPAPSRPLTPLPTGHAARSIDFWDERWLGEWEAEREREDKWEMSRAQVEELKRARREYAEAVKALGEENEAMPDLLESWTFPPRLGDDVVLSRRQMQGWQAGMPAFDPHKAMVALADPKPKHLLPRPDAALLAMDAAPDFDEAFELKLTADAEQVTALRDARQRHSSRALQALAARDAADARDEDLADCAPSSFPRLGSPPIFPRAPSLTTRLDELQLDPFGGLLPSERSDFPSSPRGPVSPTRPAPPPHIWSSSPAKLPPKNDFELEPPVFGRARQAALPRVQGFDAARLADLLKDDAPETDQLDMDDDDDGAPGCGGRARGDAGAREVFASDDTLGDPPVGEGPEELLVVGRIKPPSLPPPLSALRPAFPPPLASLASSAPSPSLWALKPLTGLRALTLELSWQAWVIPREETLESVAVGAPDEEECGDEEVERAGWGALLRAEDEEEVHEWEAPSHRWERSEDEEMVPRVPATDLVQENDGGEAHDGSPTLASQGGLLSTFETLEDGVDIGETPAFSLTDSPTHFEPLPLSSQIAPCSPAPAPPHLAPSPIQTYSATADPASDSSDFTFIDLPPLPPREGVPSRRTDEGDASFAAGRASSERGSVAECPPSNLARRPRDPLDKPTARLEKANTPGPSWSNAAALDRFLALRGRSTAAEVAIPAAAPPVARAPSLQPAPQPHSSPPPGSIPFPLPPFLASSSGLPFPSPSPVRVIAFDALFQMRAHLAALQQQALVPVHRSSRFPPTPHETHESHLLVDARSGVLFLRLDALVGNAVRTETSAPQRQEAIFSTLARLSGRKDRLLVVFEEGTQRIAGVRRYAYTPPVLAALVQLADALSTLQGGAHGVEVALSKGAEHSAELVRRWVEYLRMEDERERKEQGTPVLELWGARDWLAEDPTPDEAALLELEDMNELSACVVLGVCSANDFLGLSAQDRSASFSRLLGADRVGRISRLLASRQPPSAASQTSSSGGYDAPAVPISQVGAFDDGEAAPTSSGGSADDWAQWIDLEMSQ
ncbi:hypothetical protein JCM10450v2_002283 [Rhodotorula kratochvilovae]